MSYNPNTGFMLPAIPPRPSDTPPQQDPTGTLTRAWATLWENYRWAVSLHAAQHLALTTNATLAEGADTMVRKTQDEVILACIRAVPPSVKPTVAAWAKDVVEMGKALYVEMPKP